MQRIQQVVFAFLLSLLPLSFSKGYAEETASQSAESRVAPFYQLSLAPHDQKNIDKLMKNLAGRGYTELLYKKKEMDKLGDSINQRVHPLRFMGEVILHHKERMRKISHEHLKWIAFANGFGNRMSHEKHHNQLFPYVPGFAQMLGVSEQQVEHYIHYSDWAGLIKFLL
jgi:hypothetical protein